MLISHDFLCRAWGETDLPCVQVVPDLAGVRAFFIEQWLGEEDAQADDGTNLLTEAMQSLVDHDWDDEGLWSIEFEIGGVSVERVFAAASDAEQILQAMDQG